MMIQYTDLGIDVCIVYILFVIFAAVKYVCYLYYNFMCYTMFNKIKCGMQIMCFMLQYCVLPVQPQIYVDIMYVQCFICVFTGAQYDHWK